MKRNLPTGVVTYLERLVADPIARDGLVGDLEERFGMLEGRGPTGRTLWLARELAAATVHYGWEESGMMDALRQDLGFAARNLARRPGFSFLVVATLALGIGANTAIFSVVDGLLFEALPYAESTRLVVIGQRNAEGQLASVAFPNYRDWKERNRTFDRFSVILPGSVRLTTEAGSRILESGWVHGGFFETLGVEAEHGRTLSAGETEPGSPPAAVLSHRVWQSDFGADPGLIGSQIDLRGEPFTVVGVMPADFLFYASTDVYLPLGHVVANVAWDDRGTGGGAEVVARLAPGATLDDARADLERVVRELRAEFGDDVYDANPTLLTDWYLGDAARQALLLLAAVALVLLVACANVANLLFVRGEARRGEMALRAALGAGRGRLSRQLLTESTVYALLGGLVGALAGKLGLDALLAGVGDTLPPGAAGRIGIDGSVLAFTAGLAMLTALLAGLAPAVRSARADLAATLRDAGGRVAGGGRAREALIGAEVALSMILLVSAGLVISSLHNLRRVDKGFEADDIVTLRVSLSGAGYSTREEWAGFHERVREGVRALPAVVQASTSNHFPLSGNSWEMLYRDRNTPPDDRGISVLLTMASPEFFETFGVDIVAGRGFTADDVWGGELVAIVDETLAESRWPEESPIGQMVTFENLPNEQGEYVMPVWRRVVGVARHVRHYEVARPSRIEVYTPLAQSAASGFTSYLSVKAEGMSGSLVPEIRRVVAGVDPLAALYRIRTMDEVMRGELGTHMALRGLLAVFGGLTLLLGAVGIYSVVSHASALRVREVAVRIALGGAPSRIVAWMVGDSLRPVIVGLVVGAVGSAGAARLLGAWLFEVGPAEPAVLSAAAALLFAVAAVSAWLPASAAARTPPREALTGD